MGVASSRSQKKRYSPLDVENQRGRPPEVVRMAEKYKSKKDKNKVTDIRAPLVAREAKPPRPPTREEVKANNKAAFETAMCLFDLSWIEGFEEELTTMNQGKVGAPFKFTDTMIFWISLIMSYLDLDFRKAAGLAAGFLKSHGYPFPDYSTLKKRSDILAATGVLGAPPEDARVIARFVRVDVADRIRRCAIDSTGLNLSKTTLWRMTKWKVGPKYRGWLKLHCLVDIDTNEIIAWVLTEEKFGDTVAFPLLTELAFNAGHGIGEIYADAAYHGVENWKDTVDHDVAFVVRFLSSTVPKSNGCMARGRAAAEWCSMPYNEWVEKSGYGLRWKIECTFSDFKRVISECIDATSQDGMVRETFFKTLAFNIHKGIRASILQITGNGVVVG